jgi:hypothetical protein
MDSPWIASWLAYVHYDRKGSPAPGPCNNMRLVMYDYGEKRYSGRTGLIMARKDFGGDYRRVSKEVWELFKEYYPDSGPAITMVFNVSEKNEKGFYDTAQWKIIDAIPAPPDTTTRKKKKLQLAIPIKGLSHKHQKKGEEKDHEPTADPNARDSTSLLSPPSKQAGGGNDTIKVIMDAPNTSNISALGGSGNIGDDGYVDSDDDIDLAPLNSIVSATGSMNTVSPKVTGLKVNYTKVSEEKKSSKEVKGEAVSELSIFSFFFLIIHSSLCFSWFLLCSFSLLPVL